MTNGSDTSFQAFQ